MKWTFEYTAQRNKKYTRTIFTTHASVETKQEDEKSENKRTLHKRRHSLIRNAHLYTCASCVTKWKRRLCMFACFQIWQSRVRVVCCVCDTWVKCCAMREHCQSTTATSQKRRRHRRATTTATRPTSTTTTQNEYIQRSRISKATNDIKWKKGQTNRQRIKWEWKKFNRQSMWAEIRTKSRFMQSSLKMRGIQYKNTPKISVSLCARICLIQSFESAEKCRAMLFVRVQNKHEI